MTVARVTTWLGHHRKYAWRAFWALVLFLHAPITLQVVSAAFTPGDKAPALSSLVLLALSNAFFILEIIFACSLRVLSDRRSLLIFILIVAMLHAGAIDRSLGLASNGRLAASLFTAVLTVVGLELLAALARGLRRFLARVGPAALPLFERLYARRRMLAGQRPKLAALIIRSSAPLRAPPSHISH